MQQRRVSLSKATVSFDGGSLMTRNELIYHALPIIRERWQTQKNFASAIGHTATYISQVLRGRKTPSKPFLKAFGAEKVEMYLVKKDG
jgi:hypothetical protein